MTDRLSVVIPGRPIPAARQTRRQRNARYAEWRKRAKDHIWAAMQQAGYKPEPEVRERNCLRLERPVAVDVTAFLQDKGKLGDGDNYLKAACDALVDAKVLPNDTVRHVDRGSFWTAWVETPDEERLHILVIPARSFNETGAQEIGSDQ